MCRPLVEFQASPTCVFALWSWVGRERNWDAVRSGEWPGPLAPGRGRAGMRTGMSHPAWPHEALRAPPRPWRVPESDRRAQRGCVWGCWAPVEWLTQERWQNENQDCQLPCEGFLHTRSYQVFSLDQTHHEHYRWVVLFACGRSQHSGSNWPEGTWCLEVEEPASVSRSNPAASSDSICASRGFLI